VRASNTYHRPTSRATKTTIHLARVRHERAERRAPTVERIGARAVRVRVRDAINTRRDQHATRKNARDTRETSSSRTAIAIDRLSAHAVVGDGV